jgi:IS605 OrfB family transposase
MPPVKLKTLKIKIYPTPEQKKLIDEFIDTSRFVYNRTLEHINKGSKINFQNLRDLLVTENTKKVLNEYKEYDHSINELKRRKKELKEEIEDTKLLKEAIEKVDEQIKLNHALRRTAMKDHKPETNLMINAFELNTPKDIRACSVKQCCDAFKTGFTNLRNGNIKYFNMKYKTKKESIQTIELSPQIISIKENQIRICPTLFKDPILKMDKRNKRKLKDMQIENNVDIQRASGGSAPGYYIYISIKVTSKESKLDKIAGVDLGIRTFATVHTHSHSNGSNVISEYKHRADLLNKWNKKIDTLKKFKRVRKKHFNKLDKKKIDLTNRLHWDFINHMLNENDVIYLGDIKSHGIVKNGSNKKLNRDFNDLKFYQLKQRMFYKASVAGKKVILVPEHYTTKTCSCCGVINENVGSKEVFECSHCHLKTGRDMNASKNMKLKGLHT